MSTILIVPSLKISGGNREALRLATEVESLGRSSLVLCMWDSPHAMASDVPVELLSSWVPKAFKAPVELPALMARFSRRLKSKPNDPASSTSYVFTHYATLPLALLVPRSQRFFFVQDLEWRFIGNPIVSRVLRWVIRSIYQTGRLVSANSYLTRALKAEGLKVECEMPIWADPSFSDVSTGERDIDFVMVLRKGAHKRLDLYLDFIRRASASGQRVAVITPEDDIADQISKDVTECLLRPSADAMRRLYARSKCFIHLSQHEGFGLPPLESMGTGCVPFCRDSGGIRAFMDQGETLSSLLLPLAITPAEFHLAATALLKNEPRLKALSQEARRVFDHGIDVCAQARRGLAAALR